MEAALKALFAIGLLLYFTRRLWLSSRASRTVETVAFGIVATGMVGIIAYVLVTFPW